MTGKQNTTGLITPDDLPQDVIDTLSHGQIKTLGYWLFKQLEKQRDRTRQECKRV